MARQLGIKTINIVRSDRPEVGDVLRLLTNLGGDINVPDWYVNSSSFQEILKELPPVRLALNSVGGASATDLFRVVAPNGTIVTYGGMSKKPLTIPLDLIAQKQLSHKGFWISTWYRNHNNEDRQKMTDEVADMVRNKQLSFFFELHDLDDFQYALKKSQEPFQFRKVVLNLNYPDRLAEHDRMDAKEYEVFEAPVV